MQRLSACAQGAKSSDSKASMSAFGWLHQEGGAWQCGAVSRSASGSKHVQGRSASESGHAVSTLDRRARVEHHSASRGGIACHAGRGEGSASGGSFLCVSCAAAASAVVGKARLGGSFVTRCCPFCSRTKFDFGFDSCSYRKFSYASVKRLRLSESVRPGVTMNLSARTRARALLVLLVRILLET